MGNPLSTHTEASTKLITAHQAHHCDDHARSQSREKVSLPKHRVLAWLAKNPPTFVQHFPEIGWDSAKTKGTVLLSILPRSCRTQWLKLMIKILPLAQPAAHTPPAPVREAAQKTQRKRSPSSAARSGAHAASRYRRARSTAVHGGAELAVAALAGASGVNHGDMLRDFGRRGGLTLRRSPHEVHAPA